MDSLNAPIGLAWHAGVRPTLGLGCNSALHDAQLLAQVLCCDFPPVAHPCVCT